MAAVKGVIFAGELSDDEDVDGFTADSNTTDAEPVKPTHETTDKSQRDELLAAESDGALKTSATSSFEVGNVAMGAIPEQHEALPKFGLYRLAESAHSELSSAIRALKEKVLPTRATSSLHALEQLSKSSAHSADETVQLFTALTNQLAALDNALCTMQATTAPDGKSTGAQFRLPAISSSMFAKAETSAT